MICKIAIVDSGIDLTVHKNIIGFVDFTKNNKEISNDIYDSNGHGTKCVSVISKVNPSVEFFVVKILNDQNRCDSKSLLEALKYLLDVDVNIINMSLATNDLTYYKEYSEICNQLYSQGKIIIAALSNNRKKVYLLFYHL